MQNITQSLHLAQPLSSTWHSWPLPTPGNSLPFTSVALHYPDFSSIYVAFFPAGSLRYRDSVRQGTMSINLYSSSTHFSGDLIFFCAFKYHFYADDSQVYHVSQISLIDSTPHLTSNWTYPFGLLCLKNLKHKFSGDLKLNSSFPPHPQTCSSSFSRFSYPI